MKFVKLQTNEFWINIKPNIRKIALLFSLSFSTAYVYKTDNNVTDESELRNEVNIDVDLNCPDFSTLIATMQLLANFTICVIFLHKRTVILETYNSISY